MAARRAAIDNDMVSDESETSSSSSDDDENESNSSKRKSSQKSKAISKAKSKRKSNSTARKKTRSTSMKRQRTGQWSDSPKETLGKTSDRQPPNISHGSGSKQVNATTKNVNSVPLPPKPNHSAPAAVAKQADVASNKVDSFHPGTLPSSSNLNILRRRQIVVYPRTQVFYVKWITLADDVSSKVPIIMQERDGPCSLLAMANTLFLRGEMQLEHGTKSISAERLIALLSDRIVRNSTVRTPDQDETLAALPTFFDGMYVNVNFSGIDQFVATTGSKAFNLLNIPMFHGWLPDSDDRPIFDLAHNRTFDQLSDIQATNRNSVEARLIDQFLKKQLTRRGLSELKSKLTDGTLGVLFRNKHFVVCTIRGSDLFQLVTDIGYLNQPEDIWERISIDGNGGFVNFQFVASRSMPAPFFVKAQEQGHIELIGATAASSSHQQCRPLDFATASTQPTDKSGQIGSKVMNEKKSPTGSDGYNARSDLSTKNSDPITSPISQTATSPLSNLRPDWNLEKYGIGGLDNEMRKVFRRAFASRLLPPEFVEKLAIKHVRGILLYGPPGNGKTLVARQIGKLLNAREPKIVNGPEILAKLVGESEEKVRGLFREAEAEADRKGSLSRLHLIIIDEIDAICKRRGSETGSTANDSVVNQFLTKIDGIKQLNNILVIGMTNKRELIDDALLRPGRLEVQLEISAPDENGRFQILKIHMEKMRLFGMLDPEIDIAELAFMTKDFSGAEIEGLVRAAQSLALDRLLEKNGSVEDFKVTRSDFIVGLNDVKPAFNHSVEQLDYYLGDNVIFWDESVRRVVSNGSLQVQRAKWAKCRDAVSILIEGPPACGKTALAAQIVKNSGISTIKIYSPLRLIGLSDSEKCNMLMKTFDDAVKAPLSVVLMDDLERLLGYCPFGPVVHNQMFQTMLVLLNKKPPAGKGLLIVGTTSNRYVMEELGIVSAFSSTLSINPLTTGMHILSVVDQIEGFSPAEKEWLSKILPRYKCFVSIRKLLGIIQVVVQINESNRVHYFIQMLKEDGGLIIVS